MNRLKKINRRERQESREGREIRRREQGFTLIELVASVVIFSVGVFLIIESFGKSFDATGRVDAYTRAGFLLEEKLDEIHSEDSAKVGKESGKFEDAGSFGWEREVAETATNNLYKVTVTINWDRSKNISAITYLWGGG